MKKRIDYLEKMVDELRREIKFIKYTIFYLAGLLSVELGVKIW